MSIPVLESGLVSQRVISDEIEKIQAGAAAGQTQPRLDFAPIVQADEIVPVGALDPEHVITPCLYVDRLVRVQRDLVWSGQGL